MHIVEKSHTNIFNQGIECPNEIGNLMWAYTYVPCGVMQNSIGNLADNAETFNARLYVSAPQLSSIHWHAVSKIWTVFNCS